MSSDRAGRTRVPDALASLIADAGQETVLNSSVEAMLADQLGPDSTRLRDDIELLGHAVREGIPQDLQSGRPTEDLIVEFGGKIGDTIDSRWAVETWVAALPEAASDHRGRDVRTGDVTAQPMSWTRLLDADGPGTQAPGEEGSREPPRQAAAARRRRRLAAAGIAAVIAIALIGGVYVMRDTKVPRINLRAGQCFNGATEPDTPSGVVVVDCNSLHDGAVVAVGRLGEANAQYPGDGALGVRADELCQPLVEGLRSSREIYPFWPSRDGWLNGHRNAVCIERMASGAVLPGE